MKKNMHKTSLLCLMLVTLSVAVMTMFHEATFAAAPRPHVIASKGPAKPLKPTVTIENPDAAQKTSAVAPDVSTNIAANENSSMLQTAYKAVASLANAAYKAPGKFMNYFRLSDAPKGKIFTGSEDSVARVIGYNKDAGKTNTEKKIPEVSWNFATLGTKINDNIKSQMNQYKPGIVERFDANGTGTRITRTDARSKPTIEYIVKNQPAEKTDAEGIAAAKKAAAATTTLSVLKDLNNNSIDAHPQTMFEYVTSPVRAAYNTSGGIAQTLGGTRTGNFLSEASLKNAARGIGNAAVATPGITVTAVKGLGKGAITAVGVTAGGVGLGLGLGAYYGGKAAGKGAYYGGKAAAEGAYYGGKAALEGAAQGAQYVIESTPGALDAAAKAIESTRQMIWSGNIAKTASAVSNALNPTETAPTPA